MLTEKGKELLLAKSYDQALKVFSSALKINRMNYEAKFYWAITFLDMDWPKKAIMELSTLVDLGTKPPTTVSTRSNPCSTETQTAFSTASTSLAIGALSESITVSWWVKTTFLMTVSWSWSALSVILLKTGMSQRKRWHLWSISVESTWRIWKRQLGETSMWARCLWRHSH